MVLAMTFLILAVVLVVLCVFAMDFLEDFDEEEI